jgi:hypothetical protein
MLNAIGLVVDAAELAVAAAGTAEEGTITSGGSAATMIAAREPGPGGEAVGVLASTAVGAFVTIPADTFEDVLSWSSILLLDIPADLAGGNTYLDKHTNELVVGQDTVWTVGVQVIDQMVPGAAADLVLSGLGTVYDVYMMFPQTSGWMELRIPLDDPIGLYFAFYPDAIPDPEAKEYVLRQLQLAQDAIDLGQALSTE